MMEEKIMVKSKEVKNRKDCDRECGGKKEFKDRRKSARKRVQRIENSKSAGKIE